MFKAGLIVLFRFIYCTEEIQHLESVYENLIVDITDKESLEKNSTFLNIKKMENSLILRSNSGEGSIVNIKQETPTDNWSAEFMVKNLILRDVERAGIYLWYLDKPLEKGSYKGGSPIFNGFVTGVEFSKERADIVFAFNYGLNFDNKDIQTTRYDHINPILIDHLDEFKIKIIRTQKNFKVEIYDDKNNLLADSFRIHDPMIMNEGIKEKIFTITTKYEHCPNEIFFDLKDLKILSREETDKYDVVNIHTEHNQYPKNKSDEEIRFAIADINHFLSYLTIVLGSKAENSIVEMALAVKKKLRILRDSVDTLVETLNDSNNISNTTYEHTMQSKISELETISEELATKIENIKSKILKNDKKQKKFQADPIQWILVSCILFFIGTIAKLVSEKFFTRAVLPKKE